MLGFDMGFSEDLLRSEGRYHTPSARVYSKTPPLNFGRFSLSIKPPHRH
jgi:hypothetical protein